MTSARVDGNEGMLMRQNGFTVTLLILTLIFAVVGVIGLIGAHNYASWDYPGLAARWSAVGTFALQSAIFGVLIWLGATGVIHAVTSARTQPPGS